MHSAHGQGEEGHPVVRTSLGLCLREHQSGGCRPSVEVCMEITVAPGGSPSLLQRTPEWRLQPVEPRLGWRDLSHYDKKHAFFICFYGRFSGVRREGDIWFPKLQS